MADQPERMARIDILRRLSPVELAVLRERCRGLTSSEIGGALGESDETAAMYLGNIYDKLEITYRHEGTSMGRLMGFCPLLDEYDAPSAPLLSDIDPLAEPPPQQLSGHSLNLVRADDAALLSQRGGGGLPLDNRNWLYGIAAALMVLLIAILAVFLIVADDDDEDDDAADATATALAALQDETATETPALEATPTETPAEALEPTATPEPTETPEPTATPEPTEATEPTEVPESTPSETPEPTPTEALEPTATPVSQPTDTPAPEPPPVPAPQPGDEVYVADWSQDLEDWQVGEAWAIENDALVGTGPDAGPAIATFEPAGADYAVEALITVESLDNCDELLAGVFARVATITTDAEEYPAGYIGGVCEGEWRIEVIEDDQNERDELASGDLEIDIGTDPHTYRLEVVGDRIRFFIDDEFLGETTDDRYADSGQPGIYVTGDTQVEAEEFRVFELQPE